ncbi:uncharacterized protein Dana_GF18141 [Drosophila ananassae]|uniref:Uncharacterized protein n=1 Tax=Drosophila ananassae TaxID=7217 RepID=A0A0P8YLZ9_DROAN|nr:uncharacterized protein Dana_GF18141 [Drosophila ananassae]
MDGKFYYLCGLLVVLSLIAETLQQDTTAAPAGDSTPGAGETPKPESAGGDKTGTTEAAKPDTPGGTNPASSSGSKCKLHEIMTQGGCRPRESFLSGIIERSWKDQGFDHFKARSGSEHGGKCLAGQVMTPNGCRNMLDMTHDNEPRFQVKHSNLAGSEVVHSHFGAKLEAGKPEHNRKTKGKKKSRKIGGPPIPGHNRPRPYAYIPGRLLRSQRQCRPYETLNREGKCIRKTAVKTGKYEHRNHYYGLQKRHRHEAAEKSRRRKRRSINLFHLVK